MLTARSTRDGGFTLVEMIIALVVFAVMVGALFPLVSELTRSGSRDGSRTAATGEARIVAQLLESDLRAIRAPLRPTGDGEEVLNVIAALNRGTAPLTYPAATWPDVPTSTLWGERTNSDVLFAGPTYLMFWADVVDNPPGAFRTELVRWYLLTGTEADAGCPVGRDWCLVREVRSATNANATTSIAAREVLASGRGAIPPSRSCYPGAAIAADPQQNPRVFCYQSQVPNSYAWNAWSSTSCDARWTGLTPDPNALAGSTAMRVSSLAGPRTRAGVSQSAALISVDHEQNGPLRSVEIHPLDRITTVGATIPGGGASNGATDVALANSEVAIPSRQSAEYRTAILCGDR